MTTMVNVAAPLYIHPQQLHARSVAEEILAQVGSQERTDHFPRLWIGKIAIIFQRDGHRASQLFPGQIVEG
jgi:predicted ABC-type transport system involved in lysophospholipase L1 biosynthesis ATPase subunit